MIPPSRTPERCCCHCCSCCQATSQIVPVTHFFSNRFLFFPPDLHSHSVHFGYIYGFGISGCVLLWVLLNLMCEGSISFDRTMHIFGYCLPPIVILAAVSVFFNLKSMLPSFLYFTLMLVYSPVTCIHPSFLSFSFLPSSPLPPPPPPFCSSNGSRVRADDDRVVHVHRDQVRGSGSRHAQPAIPHRLPHRTPIRMLRSTVSILKTMYKFLVMRPIMHNNTMKTVCLSIDNGYEACVYYNPKCL